MTKHLPAHTRRLALLVNRPGGLTATEAVDAAERSLAALRDRGLSDIAATVGRMQSLVAAMGRSDEQSQANDLYRMSNSLIGISGVSERRGIGDVAGSLCTLIERMVLGRQWDGDAIKLHVDSLRLLAQGTASDAQVDTIAAALRQVLDRLQPAAAVGGPNQH